MTPALRLALLPGILCLCLAACWAGVSRAQDGPGVGIRLMTVSLPGGGAMQAAVFYPAAAPGDGSCAFGPVRVEAVRDAAPLPGRHALVALSHGNAGGMLSHHDLATALARAGFLAACPTHPGDNFRDQSRLGSPALFLGRPGNITALLDALLADPFFGPLVDPGRLGAAGFSMGAYDALVLAGARPDFQLVDGYCERPGALGFCANKSAIAATQTPANMAAPRLRAAAAMAPMDAFFSARSLSTLACPVLLLAAEKDAIVRPAEELERLLPSFPPGTRLYKTPGAGHFVFLAPCSEQQAQAAPALCTDPDGVDRRAAHQEINAEIIRFFTEKLGAQVSSRP